MKTVIITWKQDVKNLRRYGLHNYWGFGDMIRGVCGIFDVCEEFGYKLYVDMRHHPVHHFFEHIKHDYESIVDEKKDDIILNIFHTRREIIDKLHTIFQTSDLYINAMWVDPYIYSSELSSKNKEFIRNILTPTREFNDYISTQIPIQTYNIIHFRIGDIHIGATTLPDYHKYINLIQQYGNSNDIIISDNNKLKHIVKETLGDRFIVTDIDPCHVGVEINIEKIKGTLYEFILASRARHINTYSNYGWVSGFILTIHRIYDVPIIAMK
jgi:hypothetical protein